MNKNHSSFEAVKVVTLSDNAVKEINRRITEANQEATQADHQLGLRLGVKGGGCSGLSYIIDLSEVRENDHVDESRGVKIIIDPKSALYLKGVTLDYEGGFMGSGFKFVNPQASNTCGCGESFSI